MSQLGSKRVCQNCSSKYYDLLKDTPTCPACNAEYIFGGKNETIRKSGTDNDKILPDSIEIGDDNEDISVDSVDIIDDDTEE